MTKRDRTDPDRTRPDPDTTQRVPASDQQVVDRYLSGWPANDPDTGKK